MIENNEMLVTPCNMLCSPSTKDIWKRKALLSIALFIIPCFMYTAHLVADFIFLRYQHTLCGALLLKLRGYFVWLIFIENCFTTIVLMKLFDEKIWITYDDENKITSHVLMKLFDEKMINENKIDEKMKNENFVKTKL